MACPVTGSVLDHEVLDELLARPIEPVEILEEEDGRLPGAARTGEPSDHVEEPSLPGLRVERRSRAFRIRHAKEIEHDREPLGELLVEQYHPTGDLVAGRPRRVLLSDPEVATEELEDREQGTAFPWATPRAS
jgi:hypothetical protein